MKIKFFVWILLSISLLNCRKDELTITPPNPEFNSMSGKDIDLNQTYDVVIYGGTASGIIAAVEVTKSGKTVLLINPKGSGLGGMVTNGLGVTDLVRTDIVGGLTRDFFKGIKTYYQDMGNWFKRDPQGYRKFYSDGDIMIWFEPKASRSVFADFINENRIPILQNERLDLKNGVTKDTNKRIKSIRMESGKVISGKVFIDASYEGDLMAKAGVSYIVGRESKDKYGEYFNGVQKKAQYYTTQLPDGISGTNFSYIPESLLPPDGSADKKIQPYCFRMCLTNLPENRIDIEKPADYDESKYQLLFDYLKVYNGDMFFDRVPLPNFKTDSNNAGPVSTDYVGKNYDYPEGDYATRDRIINEHKSYQLGLLWTLANSEKVPQKIRDIYKEWGLPKDEFVSNQHWPFQLYIREARRMVSGYVMTQYNCEGKRFVEQPIGKSYYMMDSHVIQRYIDSKGFVKNEGGLALPVLAPYFIDYRSIIPIEEECNNLLVPVCLSASHVAYSSIRMEPVYMILGQSAAAAAVIAIDKNISVQKVDYNQLKTALESKGVVL